VFVTSNGRSIYEQLCIERGWNVEEWGAVPDYYVVKAKFEEEGIDAEAPLPGDVVRAIPQGDAKVYWRIMPRFGISHPVSNHTKFFFNYGVFHSQQKAAVRYGMGSHNRLIGKTGWFKDLYNPNLRPARTTMYEVGVEHAFPLGFVATCRGYSKYNVDIVRRVRVQGTLIQEYSIFRNPVFGDIRGAEIKIARSSGRFLNGWFTYERTANRNGQVGLEAISDDPLEVVPFLPFTRGGTSNGSFRGLVRIGTPRDWGPLAGGWSLSVIQSYSSGGEAVYNPLALPAREIPEEYYIPMVDNWNTALKLTKNLRLPGGRSLSAYLDITNAWDKKRLNGTFLNGEDYLLYLVERRRAGDAVKYGDESTYYVLTEPYKSGSGAWKAPISPRTDWLHHLNPRSYRLGVRFNL